MKRSSWSGTHFSGEENRHFPCLFFLSSRYKCRLLHFSLQMYSFLHRLILKSAFVRKKNVESVLLRRARLIVTRWCLWFDEPLGIQGEILRWTRMRFFFRSSLSSKPRDKKQHCHLRFADVLLLKKDSEESIASIFSKKNGTSGTNEFLPKMSSNRCCVFIARIDLAKIMKLMLRVSSESKYSFFNRKVIEHIVEKMDVVVWSTEAELFLSGSREERVWSSKLGMRVVSSLWIFFFQSWPLFRRRLASRRQTLQAGHFSEESS